MYILFLHFSSTSTLLVHAFGIWRYIFGKFNFEESLDSLFNFLICVNIPCLCNSNFQKYGSYFQRQSYVFTLLTRPESIVSHIGFHLADVTIAHLHDETLLLYWKRKFNIKIKY